MTRPILLPLALGCLAACATAGWAADEVTPPRSATLEVQSHTTVLRFPAHDSRVRFATDGELGALVALPPDATAASVTLRSGQAGEVVLAGPLMRLRGRNVAAVRIGAPGPGPLTVAVDHDGDWLAKSDDRLHSVPLLAGLPGLPAAAAKSLGHPLGGSYVLICAPRFLAAVAPLAAWKQRKGWPVVTVTTEETGFTGAAIRAWLQHAYETWARPPEYVLLVGDVEDIPTFFIDGNVTDLPYALVDGDDWLPDLMLGRFAIASEAECATIVAKTVSYEREPYLDDPTWLTRSVLVGGQYGSTTPMYTVRFCGEQLQQLGHGPLVPVTPTQLVGNYIVSPYQAQELIGIPQTLGPPVINASIDAGCSFVVYRGWAYNIAGWQYPDYRVQHLVNLDNGRRLPVVFSFVCFTGDFNATTPCMGETFTRLGGSEPAQMRGAVAFYGNGEPHSRTRYNDAIAISTFERITEPGLSTLGSLVTAGKLRFMEFFPGSLAETGDGFSVEFYFHIYNLLGDPELNYHRGLPTALAVTHQPSVAAGATLLELAVAEAESGQPLAGARVGVVQAGRLLGAATSGADGTVRVVLQPAVAVGTVALTVTRAGRLPYTAELGAGAGPVFLALDDLAVVDDGGEPATVRPGARLRLLPVLRNLGTETSGEAVLALTAAGPASVTIATAVLAPLAGGQTGAPPAGFEVEIAAEAPDGALIEGYLTADHGGQSDRSGFTLAVLAPDLLFLAAPATGDPWLEPGATTDLTLTVTNGGALTTAGGVATFSLTGPVGAVLLTGSLPFGALAAGGGEAVLGPLTVQLADAVAAGTTLNVAVEAVSTEGAVLATTIAVAIGRGDISEPTGPDAHGYYAYDSADWLYPDQRPVYRWREISTALGGDGIRLPFYANNWNRNVVVELPFPFTFYGQSFTSVRVSDNGWLSFDAANDFYNFYNWPIPLAHGNGGLVAPFWDNLTPEPSPIPEDDPVGMDSDGIYWYHDAAAGEVIFEWSRMRHVYAEIPELQTFQAVLRDPAVHATTPTGDGEILFFYKQVADNDHLRMYATVGIESPDESDGLELTYDGVRARGFAPLGPGTAVRLTTAPPVRVPVVASDLSRRQDGDQAHLAWTVADPRPLVGWRIHATGPGGRTCLTPEPLPGDARAWTAAVEAEVELVLEALLPDGAVCEAGRAGAAAAVPRFALSEPTPNPLRSETSLAFALPRGGEVRLRVFDVRGRCVATLLDGRTAAGEHLLVWQGRGDQGRRLADGVYVLRLEQDGRILTRKLLLVR